jgi:hypothetical protein
MEFTFKLKREDWLSFVKVANRRLSVLAKANPKLLVVNILVWIPLGIALATFAALYRKYPEISHDLNVVAAAAAVGFFLLVASFVYKQRLYQSVAVSDTGTFLAPYTVQVDANGLSLLSSFGSLSYPWDCFIHRAEDEARVYLFVDNVLGLIIPKNALGSPAQVAQFRQWAGLAR